MGVVHQEADFVISILPEQPFQALKVFVVHGNDMVIIMKIVSGNHTRSFAFATDAVLGQLASRWWIDGVANFLGGGGSRSNLKLVAQACFFNEVFHHELGHGTATDVAVADEKDFMDCVAHGLELEIDECLQVGGDELVDDEHDGDTDQHHHGQGHLGEPNAITPLELLWQPVNNHSQHDEDEYVAVVIDDVGYLLYAPMAAHLVDHVFSGIPSRFVGFGGVEVGTAAEEQSREGDESEGVEHRPGILQPLPGTLAAKEVVEHPYHIAREDDKAPREEHPKYRQGEQNTQHSQGEGDGEDE